MMIEDVQGCAMNMRYHSERADFTIKDSSRAKIEITPENGLIINIDARNTGEWTECVTIPNLPLPAEWTRAAHIGITASTGQLADNHDVISFITYDNNQVLTHLLLHTRAYTHSVTSEFVAARTSRSGEEVL